MPDLFLFDIDGTLVGPCPPHGRSMLSAVSQIYGIEVNPEQASYAGMTDRQILRRMLRESELSEELIERDIASCIDLTYDLFHSVATPADLRLLPGVEAVLRHLKDSGATLGLVTGNVERIAYRKLALAGIDTYFTFGGFGCEHHIERYELVEFAMSRAAAKGWNAGKTYVIGDTPRDIEAGKRAGAYTIAVATGRIDLESLQEHLPHAALANMGDLSTFLRALEVD